MALEVMQMVEQRRHEVAEFVIVIVYLAEFVFLKRHLAPLFPVD